MQTEKDLDDDDRGLDDEMPRCQYQPTAIHSIPAMKSSSGEAPSLRVNEIGPWFACVRHPGIRLPARPSGLVEMGRGPYTAGNVHARVSPVPPPAPAQNAIHGCLETAAP